MAIQVNLPESSPAEVAASIRKQAQKQKKASRAIRIVIVFLLVIATAVCILGLPVLSLMIGPGLFHDTPDYFIPIFLLIAYSVFYIIPFLLCLPIVVPAATRSKNTSRIVVFRKFNDDVSKKALRRLIASTFGYYGHVFTLSDKNFKIRWYVRLPVLLGQLTFFHFRQRVVRTQAHVARLQRTLENKAWLNVNWYFSTTKVFSIRTTDERWQETARVLLSGADLVIFDVSTFTASLEWETNITKELNLEQCIVVVANEANKATAFNWKKTYDRQDDDYDIPLHFYDLRSKLDSMEKLESDVINVLARKKEFPVTYKKGILKQAFLTAVYVAVAFLGCLVWLSPYVIPGIAGMYSPVKTQVFQSYLQLDMQGGTEVQDEVFRRIKNKWPQQAAAFSVKYAFGHDNAECASVENMVKVFADTSQWQRYVDLVLRGEPRMSQAGFEALQKVRSLKRAAIDMRELGLRFISAPRVDIKSRGLSLLQKDPADRRTLSKLLQIFSYRHYQLDSTPFQHKNRSGLFNVGKMPRYFAELFYRDLYRYLDTQTALIPERSLEEVIMNTPDKDVQYVFSLMLLKGGNALQLERLFDGNHIQKFYRWAYKEETGLLSLFSPISHPFAELIDSILVADQPLRHLPAYEQLFRRRQNWRSGYPLPAAMITFLGRHYTADVLHDVEAYTDLISLMEAMHALYEKGSPVQRQRTLQMVREERTQIMQLLSDTTHQLQQKLDAAKLLAATGEMKIIPFVIQASTELDNLFWPKHYKTQAAEILDSLIMHANSRNAIVLPQLPVDLSDRIRMRLDILKEKWSY